MILIYMFNAITMFFALRLTFFQLNQQFQAKIHQQFHSVFVEQILSTKH